MGKQPSKKSLRETPERIARAREIKGLRKEAIREAAEKRVMTRAYLVRQKIDSLNLAAVKANRETMRLYRQKDKTFRKARAFLSGKNYRLKEEVKKELLEIIEHADKLRTTFEGMKAKAIRLSRYYEYVETAKVSTPATRIEEANLRASIESWGEETAKIEEVQKDSRNYLERLK